MEYTNKYDFEERLYQLEKKFYYFHYDRKDADPADTTWFETKIYYNTEQELAIHIKPGSRVQILYIMGGFQRGSLVLYKHLGMYISMLFDALSNDQNIHVFEAAIRKYLMQSA